MYLFICLFIKQLPVGNYKHSFRFLKCIYLFTNRLGKGNKKVPLELHRFILMQLLMFNTLLFP